jgi:hypothetical protein
MVFLPSKPKPHEQESTKYIITMHSFSAFVALLTATSISAVPLNINLGAYSPALVVGDGEISFRGAEDVAVLVETLAGAPTGTTPATPNAGITRAGTVDAADDKTPTIITPAASHQKH